MNGDTFLPGVSSRTAQFCMLEAEWLKDLH